MPTNTAATISNGSEAANKPLFLTPLLKAGKIQEAKEAAKTTLGFGIQSYSGFFTVDEKHNSNIFFWFFPAEENPLEAPLILWLEGGPGENGFFGAFVQHGPYKITENTEIEKRDVAWTKYYNILYIDQPVGTGFSFTDNPAGYSQSVSDVNNNLYTVVTQFFTLFEEFNRNDFYVAGISYGAKFAMWFSEKLMSEIDSTINFKGVIIASGFVDPTGLLKRHEFYHQQGMIDAKVRDASAVQYSKFLEEMDKKSLSTAFKELSTYCQNLRDMSGYDRTADSVFYPTAPRDYFHYEKYLEQTEVRNRLHVGELEFHSYYGSASSIRLKLLESFFDPVSTQMERVLQSGRSVLFFTGQQDILTLQPVLSDFLEQLQWDGQEDFSKTEREIWSVGKEMAGYVKSARNLTYVVVRNAGHIVVYDQPEWAWDMISRFLPYKRT